MLYVCEIVEPYAQPLLVGVTVLVCAVTLSLLLHVDVVPVLALVAFVAVAVLWHRFPHVLARARRARRTCATTTPPPASPVYSFSFPPSTPAAPAPSVFAAAAEPTAAEEEGALAPAADLVPLCRAYRTTGPISATESLVLAAPVASPAPPAAAPPAPHADLARAALRLRANTHAAAASASFIAAGEDVFSTVAAEEREEEEMLAGGNGDDDESRMCDVDALGDVFGGAAPLCAYQTSQPAARARYRAVAAESVAPNTFPYKEAAAETCAVLGVGAAQLPAYRTRAAAWLRTAVVAPLGAALTAAQRQYPSAPLAALGAGDAQLLGAAAAALAVAPAALAARVAALAAQHSLEHGDWRGAHGGVPDARVLAALLCAHFDRIIPGSDPAAPISPAGTTTTTSSVFGGGGSVFGGSSSMFGDGGSSSAPRRVFSEEHYAVGPALPGATRAREARAVLLFERTAAPPHYEVWFDGRCWAVAPGHQNFFTALVLFARAVDLRLDGHLGALSLRSHTCDLLTRLNFPRHLSTNHFH